MASLDQAPTSNGAARKFDVVEATIGDIQKRYPSEADHRQ
jgi:hypothetical protein